MLHVRIFLVSPLGSSNMMQLGTDQYERGIVIWKTAYPTSATANLQVQPLNDIIGTNASPALTGKIAIGQRFLNAILYLLSSLLQLHSVKLFYHGFGFFSLTAFCSPRHGEYSMLIKYSIFFI